jgi:flavodoxin
LTDLVFTVSKGVLMKTLVVYFSRSGHTAQVAREIAQRMGADVEEIREARQRAGIWGYCRSALQVLTRAQTPIEPSRYDPAGYDNIVLGTPVWIQRPAPPVVTYARRHAASFKRVAFFCTEGGAGDAQVFQELEKLCGKPPGATLTVTEKQLPQTEHAALLDKFVAQAVT